MALKYCGGWNLEKFCFPPAVLLKSIVPFDFLLMFVSLFVSWSVCRSVYVCHKQRIYLRTIVDVVFKGLKPLG